MKSDEYLFFETLGTELKIDILLKLKEKPYSVTELAYLTAFSSRYKKRVKEESTL